MSLFHTHGIVACFAGHVHHEQNILAAQPDGANCNLNANCFRCFY